MNVAKLVPEVAYVCPKCKVAMVHNGSKRIGRREVQFFKCPQCGKQCEDPVFKHRNKLSNVIYLLCDCFSFENFECEEIGEGMFRYTCRNCKSSFITNIPPNPYKRYIEAKKGREFQILDKTQSDLSDFI